MNVIPLSEAKANLSRYGRLCQDEPVIVTVNGVPSVQLTPLKEDDDLIDRLLAETGVAFDLEAAGISKDRIVLAFKSPKIRPHTGYAVA